MEWSLALLVEDPAPSTAWDAIRQFFTRSSVTTENPSPLTFMWEEIFGQTVVPYDLAERHKRLAHAYEQLAPYIRSWEALRESAEEF